MRPYLPKTNFYRTLCVVAGWRIVCRNHPRAANHFADEFAHLLPPRVIVRGTKLASETQRLLHVTIKDGDDFACFVGHVGLQFPQQGRSLLLPCRTLHP